MSMLYLAVADRLKWPIVPVRAAKHIFCRYISHGFKDNNIEATCGGGYLDIRRNCFARILAQRKPKANGMVFSERQIVR